ncbi:MAG: 50S ribosomal protein L13 [Candidatus Thermoplasmatota archaeon]|nr:50S ribosomal protein L13 [Candidatus Thermoplasmatota archaeon]
MKAIDATGCTMGRLSSYVAKELLNGEKVIVVNAEKAYLSGSKEFLIREYKKKRERGTQRKGPFFPRMPDRILKRTIRDMLPYQKPRGREAYKNLRVYIGVPDEVKKESIETMDSFQFRGLKGMTLLELSKEV